jgi:hypothetical protein
MRGVVSEGPLEGAIEMLKLLGEYYHSNSSARTMQTTSSLPMDLLRQIAQDEPPPAVYHRKRLPKRLHKSVSGTEIPPIVNKAGASSYMRL